MFEPDSGSPDAIRDAKARLLKAIDPLTPVDLVRGQFDGYRREPNVAPRLLRRDVRGRSSRRSIAGDKPECPYTFAPCKRLPVTCTEVLVELKVAAPFRVRRRRGRASRCELRSAFDWAPMCGDRAGCALRRCPARRSSASPWSFWRRRARPKTCCPTSACSATR